MARMFLGITFCGIIGGFLAMLWAPAFWWAGVSAGALLGYLSYDWRKVASAASDVYWMLEGWRPNTAFWKLQIKQALAVMGIMQTGIAFFLAIHPSTYYSSQAAVWNLLILMVGVSVMSFLMGMIFQPPTDTGRLERFSYIHTNPVTVAFYHLPRVIWWGLVWAAPRTLPALRAVTVGFVFLLVGLLGFSVRYTVLFFKIIHSDERLFWGGYSALASMIAYFSGYLILGAMAGAALGVVNYQLITKRRLGLTFAR